MLTTAAELTMPEASAIADNTLEATVRALLSALHAAEILKAGDSADKGQPKRTLGW